MIGYIKIIFFKFLLLIVGTLFNNCFAQVKPEKDYIEFYHLCNSGDSLVYFKQYNDAVKKYEAAFLLKEPKRAIFYTNAASAAAKSSDYEKAYSFARKAILKGAQQFDTAILRKHLSRPQITDSVRYWRQYADAKLDKAYKRLIDSLVFVDQCVIREYCDEVDVFKIDSASLPEDKFEMDETLFNLLLTKVKTEGFPTPEMLGEKTFESLWVLFHHNVRKPQNEQYVDMLIQETKNGNYQPEMFAWMYDQLMMNKGQKPHYYYGVSMIDHLTQEQKAEIDNRRFELAIKPFSSTSFEKIDNGVRQNRLW